METDAVRSAVSFTSARTRVTSIALCERVTRIPVVFVVQLYTHLINPIVNDASLFVQPEATVESNGSFGFPMPRRRERHSITSTNVKGSVYAV